MYAKFNDDGTIEIAPVNKITNIEVIYNYNQNAEMMDTDGYRELSAEEEALYSSGIYTVLNKIIIPDIYTTVNIAAMNVYKYIISQYENILNYGVVQVNDTYYANMNWYTTWTKAVSLYENYTMSPDSTFTVRLYKSNSTIDGVYYNYDTQQNLATLKQFLITLNSKQFTLYQPIKNNILSQLLIYKNSQSLEGIESVRQLATTAFGDYINESTTIVEYGA